MQPSSPRLPHIARALMGLMFLVFGLNFFLHFLPLPPMPHAAEGFMLALVASRYAMVVVKVTEVVAGVLLLSNRFVPLALALLAPIVVGIVGFHTVLAPQGAAIALLLLGLEIYLAYSYRSAYLPMLAARVSPHRSAPTTRPLGNAREA